MYHIPSWSEALSERDISISPEIIYDARIISIYFNKDWPYYIYVLCHIKNNNGEFSYDVIIRTNRPRVSNSRLQDA